MVVAVCGSVVTDTLIYYTDATHRPRHPDERWRRSLPKVAVTAVIVTWKARGGGRALDFENILYGDSANSSAEVARCANYFHTSFRVRYSRWERRRLHANDMVSGSGSACGVYTYISVTRAATESELRAPADSFFVRVLVFKHITHDSVPRSRYRYFKRLTFFY